MIGFLLWTVPQLLELIREDRISVSITTTKLPWWWSVCERASAVKGGRCFPAPFFPPRVDPWTFVEPVWLFHRKTHTFTRPSLSWTHTQLCSVHTPHLPPPIFSSLPTALPPSLPALMRPMWCRRHRNINVQGSHDHNSDQLDLIY